MDTKKLNKELYYVSLYISVSNLNASENDSESEWGKLAQIKSDITGKKLIIFLQMLSESSPAKNLMYWFFNDIYYKNTDKYILGIVKNVNIYRKINSKREWIFKFDFNKKNNILDIVFEWRNEYKTPIKELSNIISSEKYDTANKKIAIDEETTSDELEKIKSDLVNIIEMLNFSEENLIYNTSEEIAVTNELINKSNNL